MNYPEEFYYLDEGTGVEYSSTPTGEMDIHRLIQGKSYWISQTKKEKKPKHLVLTDWRARNWSFSKKAAVIEKLEKLIDKGFKIYVWEKDRLLPLPKHDLDMVLLFSQVLNRIPPLYVEEVAQKAFAQYQIPADHLLCLDDLWMDCIFSGKPKSDSRILWQSHLISLISDELDKLINLLSKSPISEILDDTYVCSINEMFKDIPHKAIHRREYLSYINASFLTRKEASEHIEELRLTDLFSKDITQTELNNLQQLPKLYSLDISKPILLEREINFLKSLQNIEEFSVVCSGNTLFKILEGMPNLRSLKVVFLANDSTTFPSVTYKLLKLKKIEFRSRAQTPIDMLQKLLEVSPHLVSLEMQLVAFEGSTPLTCGLLSQLRILNLEYTKLTKESIQAILSQAPMLRELKLSEPQGLSLQPNELKHLEQLGISQINVLSKEFSDLLVAAPHIRKLTLSDIKGLSKKCELPQHFYLEKLETLYITSFALLVN